MAIYEDGSRRIALQKDGWRSLAHLNSLINEFEASIRGHLRTGRIEHLVNSEASRRTNYYRLTPRGRRWAKAAHPELLLAFRRTRVMNLELSREQLQRKGWFPFVFTTHHPNPLLFQKELIVTKKFKRGKKFVEYYKITPDGVSFARLALWRESRRRFENSLCGITKLKRSDIRQLRAESNAWLRREIRALDAYELYSMTLVGSNTIIPAVLAEWHG